MRLRQFVVAGKVLIRRRWPLIGGRAQKRTFPIVYEITIQMHKLCAQQEKKKKITPGRNLSLILTVAASVLHPSIFVLILGIILLTHA